MWKYTKHIFLVLYEAKFWIGEMTIDLEECSVFSSFFFLLRSGFIFYNSRGKYVSEPPNYAALCQH